MARIQVDKALQAIMDVFDINIGNLGKYELSVLLDDLINEFENKKDIVDHEIEELENPTPPTKNLNNLKPKK